MVKTKILGDRAIITAGMKYEDLVKVEKYAPDTTVLVDDNSNEIFRVSTGNCDGVSCIGITFMKSGEDAVARITIPMCEENKTDYIAENYGIIISKTQTIIDAMEVALDGVEEAIKKIKDNIEEMR